MTGLQELLNAPKNDTYEKLIFKLVKITNTELLYGSLFMWTVIIASAV